MDEGDKYKEWAAEQYARGTHKGRRSHGHKGNCSCRRPNCHLCRRSDSEQKKVADRQAARQDAVV